MSLAVIAHGVGTRGDLPLPLPLFVGGVGIALALSFVGLMWLWPEARLGQAARGRTLLTIPPWVTSLLAGVGYVLFVLSLAAGWLGDNVVYNNLLPVAFYVTVWVGGQLVAGLLGDLWPALNPMVTMARLVDGESEDGAPRSNPAPEWGHWPATVGLFIFLFYELSHPSGSLPRTLAVLLTTHLAVTVIAARAWGWEWVRDNEPFTVLFAALGAMGPLFADDGRLKVRAPLSGLADMTVKAGTGAMLLTVIGGTSFDGFSESSNGRQLFGDFTGWSLAAAETVVMVLSIAVVAGLFAAGVWWTARVTELTAERAWRAFTPSLVPIVFGYTVAHYFQLFVDNIQVFVFRLADPFGAGWNLLGLADNVPWRIDPDVTSWVQVIAMLIGHVGAVVVAHDRAVTLFKPATATRSQLVMVVVMIAYSALGLWLLLTA